MPKWTLERYAAAYENAAHGIQSGIKLLFTRQYPWADERLVDWIKHVRVGVDTGKSDLGALVGLLVKKGLITDDEWADASLAGLERERERYLRQVNRALGLPDDDQRVSLG